MTSAANTSSPYGPSHTAAMATQVEDVGAAHLRPGHEVGPALGRLPCRMQQHRHSRPPAPHHPVAEHLATRQHRLHRDHGEQSSRSRARRRG